MAFTIETGAGVAGANAYATAAQVLAYLTDRGRETENSWSTTTPAEQQAAIIKATDYIEKRFFGIWRGDRSGTVQALAWPRTGVVTRDGVEIEADAIPYGLISAVAEYTVRAVAKTLFADPAAAASGSSGVVTETFSKVAAIETRTKYSDPAVAGAATIATKIPSYPAADYLLQPYLTRSLSGGGLSVGRLARL